MVSSRKILTASPKAFATNKASTLLRKTARSATTESHDSVDFHSIRSAHPRDIDDSDLTTKARHVWVLLCDHRNKYTNIAFPKAESLARRSGFSLRTTQRALQELLAKNWICKPNGDAGGRPSNDYCKRRKTTVEFHLHPDGRPCDLRARPLKQQIAASRRFSKSDQRAEEKDDVLSSFLGKERMTGTLEKDDNLHGKDDNSGSPYKEETSLPKNQNGTTTSLQSPELLRISEGSSAIGEGEKDVDGVVFEAIETILRSARGVPRGHLGTAERPLLDGLAKSKILHALENQGYTIHHLLFIVPWESLKRAYNPAGFLIQFATELKSRFQHCKWPNCLLCLDSGVVK